MWRPTLHMIDLPCGRDPPSKRGDAGTSPLAISLWGPHKLTPLKICDNRINSYLTGNRSTRSWPLMSSGGAVALPISFGVYLLRTFFSLESKY